jgi:hypothetical protein
MHSADKVQRFPLLDLEQLDDQQRPFADEILKVASIGTSGPFNMLLRSPVMGLRMFVRPAWAHSYGCKSRRKLVTASEVKRNCMRATECGEEAWIEAAGR